MQQSSELSLTLPNKTYEAKFIAIKLDFESFHTAYNFTRPVFPFILFNKNFFPTWLLGMLQLALTILKHLPSSPGISTGSSGVEPGLSRLEPRVVKTNATSSSESCFTCRYQDVWWSVKFWVSFCLKYVGNAQCVQNTIFGLREKIIAQLRKMFCKIPWTHVPWISVMLRC